MATLTATVQVLWFAVMLLLCRGSQELTSRQAEEKHLLDQLLQTYDARIRPSQTNGTDGPVKVEVALNIHEFTSISDYDMDFGLLVLLREEWMDERLKYEGKGQLPYLTLKDSEQVWTPDLYVVNEKDSHLHKLTTPNLNLRIYPSGRVVFSIRMSVTIFCHMHLARFPFDTQVCDIGVRSYGFTSDDLELSWKSPVVVPKHANDLGFSLDRFSTPCCETKANKETYSCLKVKLYFKRDLKYFIIHNFMPCAVLVMVSWASFWMDRHDVVARLLLVLYPVFAMNSLGIDIDATVPHVSYPKAMDVWTGVCYMFVLAALVEFVVVNATSASQAVGNEEGTSTVGMNLLTRQSTDFTQPKTSTSPTPFYEAVVSWLPRDPRRIDSVARSLFPTLFLVFVLLYFIVFLVGDVFSSPDSLE